VLGGGLSSRLFQTVREDRVSPTASCRNERLPGHGPRDGERRDVSEKADELSTVVAAQVGEVAAQGITAEELEIARDRLRGIDPVGPRGDRQPDGRLGSSQSLLGRVLARTSTSRSA
jgi:predicted Zn-dependent peptidase